MSAELFTAYLSTDSEPRGAQGAVLQEQIGLRRARLSGHLKARGPIWAAAVQTGLDTAQRPRADWTA